MNVIHLRDILYRGGIENLLLDICKNAKTHGINITLVVFNNGVLNSEFIESGIELVELKRNYSIDFSLIRKLRRIIIEKNITIIHSHQALEGLYAYLATIGLDVKNIISHHGSIYPLKDKLVMKYLIPRVDANIAVSKGYLNRLGEKEGFNIKKNFFVVYNGIDKKKIEIKKTLLKDELKIPPSSILLGMVGNFNPIRDQFTICKALPEIFKQFSNVYFVFVGAFGDSKNELYQECFTFCKDKKILDKTFFLGARDDIGNILNNLDIFVYSSNRDTFGIAVVEAMISGIPVVVNDLPPLLEITDNGNFAKIYESKNFMQLKNIVSELIENSNERINLSKAGKLWAEENFLIDNHIKSLIKIYKKNN